MCACVRAIRIHMRARTREDGRFAETKSVRNICIGKRIYIKQVSRTNIIGTSAHDKFIEGVAAGKIRDYETIPGDIFSERELGMLYTAGYIYLFQFRGKSCFKAIV